MGDLSAHFSRHEFACQCGCGYDAVDPRLIETLEFARSAVGGPLHITSGCRCDAHNLAVGGVENSAHTRGKAADISCVDARTRHRLVQALLEAGAFGVGVAKSFVHADIDVRLPRPALWGY